MNRLFLSAILLLFGASISIADDAATIPETDMVETDMVEGENGVWWHGNDGYVKDQELVKGKWYQEWVPGHGYGYGYGGHYEWRYRQPFYKNHFRRVISRSSANWQSDLIRYYQELARNQIFLNATAGLRKNYDLYNGLGNYNASPYLNSNVFANNNQLLYQQLQTRYGVNAQTPYEDVPRIDVNAAQQQLGQSIQSLIGAVPPAVEAQAGVVQSAIDGEQRRAEQALRFQLAAQLLQPQPVTQTQTTIQQAATATQNIPGATATAQATIAPNPLAAAVKAIVPPGGVHYDALPVNVEDFAKMDYESFNRLVLTPSCAECHSPGKAHADKFNLADYQLMDQAGKEKVRLAIMNVDPKKRMPQTKSGPGNPLPPGPTLGFLTH
jgi:hypothetical protein